MTNQHGTGLLEWPDRVALAGPGLPRLLPDPPVTSLVAHRAHWGPMPDGDLVGETCRSGLRGRGGAGFPTGLKMKAVQRAAGGTGWRRRRPIVVANGTEGEPASAKDRALLLRSPHLVLDGLAAAAASLGAQRAILCVKHDQRPVLAALERALAERRGQDEIELELSTVPSGYVSGEESALVNWLTAGVPRPTITPPRPSERGVCSRPTLVDNVETMANLGVIARLGADWWRGLGTEDDPGSILLTISGAVARPGVYEVANGSRLRDAVALAGPARSLGVLVGGYFGTWLTPAQAAGARLSRASLDALGGSLGCGVVAVLPDRVCPLEESARVVRWLAGESAGQCGPCVNGLPAIAGAIEALARGTDVERAEQQARRWAGMVEGRGGCKLPDGAARFVRSALHAFSTHVALHMSLAGPCPQFGSQPSLPFPAQGSDLRWA